MPAPTPRLRPGASALYPSTPSNREPPSRLQRDRGWAGALPLVGVKACGLLRCATALPVTPTTPVRSFLGSSVELPSASVRAGPAANRGVPERGRWVRTIVIPPPPGTAARCACQSGTGHPGVSSRQGISHGAQACRVPPCDDSPSHPFAAVRRTHGRHACRQISVWRKEVRGYDREHHTIA